MCLRALDFGTETDLVEYGTHTSDSCSSRWTARASLLLLTEIAQGYFYSQVIDAAILEQSAWNCLSWNCRHQTGMTHNLLVEIPYVLEILLFPFKLFALILKILFSIYFVIFLILMQDEQILNTVSFTY